MPGIDSVADQLPSEMEVTKREAENGGSGAEGAEQPPSKKARVDEPANSEEKVVSRQDLPEHERGIAPIKAEYDFEVASTCDESED